MPENASRTGQKLTYKQCAAQLRKHLSALAGIPGVRYEIRATKTGVNVSIVDDGYVNACTGGDRAAISKTDLAAVVNAVNRIRDNYFQPPLPGTTKWGPIMISVTMDPTPTIISSRERS